MLSSHRVDPEVFIAGLAADLAATNAYEIGFPGGKDIDFGPVWRNLFDKLLNNIGDPFEPGSSRAQTKVVEQNVVTTLASWLRAPGRPWGYVTTGSTEATLHALYEGRECFHDAIVYTSAAAHSSVVKAANILRLPLVTVRTDVTGRMDVAEFRAELSARRRSPALIVATAGTTMTEAIDDVAAIAEVCDHLGVRRRRIHVDAALSGIPLALLPDGVRPRFDFTAGATSMAVSGHKFLATRMPCGVILYAAAPYRSVRSTQAIYTGSPDTTIVGSRSGHTPLLLWWSLTTVGIDGHRARAEASRRLAQSSYERLREMGWPTARNAHAFTVSLALPPVAVTNRWVIAAHGNIAHIICLPGREASIAEFLADLRAATRNGVVRPRDEPSLAVTPVDELAVTGDA
jgi:histidine decarboxylase